MPLLPPVPPPRVLLIEHNPDLLDLLHPTLTEADLPVMLAISTAEAQILLGPDPFALMVTDLFRPLQGTHSARWKHCAVWNYSELLSPQRS